MIIIILMAIKPKGEIIMETEREMHKVSCAGCNKETEVPFKPDGKRPVYCRECYSKKKNSR